jgi:hypothetical protein
MLVDSHIKQANDTMHIIYAYKFYCIIIKAIPFGCDGQQVVDAWETDTI